MVSIARLIPYANNARKHSDEQVAQIAASITEFGWTVPALIAEDGTLIAGHGRVLAAKALGIAKIPVMTARGWSDAQRRAYTLADNQLALNATWDEALLRIEIKDLEESGFKVAIIGFDAGELASMLNAASAEDPEAAPELPTGPTKCQLGDVWILGRHRLVCGDSTKAETVAQALNGAKPGLMVTDPPYGVEYDPDWRNGAKIGATAIGKVKNDDRVDWREAWSLFPGDIAYVWHASYFISTAQASLEADGFAIRAQIIWKKDRMIIGRGDYHWQHEPCWYAVRKGRKGNWQGDRTQTTVWDIAHRASETGHSTQKPIECMLRPIENNSKAGDLVYDPFCGSGMTVIAAEMSGRSCIAIELSPAYCDVIVERWEKYSGKTAEREKKGPRIKQRAVEVAEV